MTISERDADLSTPQARIAWFCQWFEVTPPTLAYDDEEPDQLLLTDALLRWCRLEGVSLDWLFSGLVAGALAAHREKHRMTPDDIRLIDVFGQYSEDEQMILLEGIKRGEEPGADFEAEVKTAMEQIKAKRKAA